MKKTIILGSNKSVDEYAALLKDSKDVQLTGYIDPDDSLNYNMFGDFIKILEIIQTGDNFIIGNQVKNVSFDVICQMMKFGKNIFIDGYRNWSANELDTLQKLRMESETIFQFGNTLYSLPLFTTSLQYLKKPRFIKLEKHCQAPKTGEFNQWIFNQLAQELDLINRIIGSNIRSISARPMFLFGEHTDLLNIHIEYDNDAICHISLGRAIEENTHKLRVFQHEKLFHIDFHENQLMEFRLASNTDQLSLNMNLTPHQSSDIQQFISIDRNIMPYDVKRMELRNFFENIDKNLSPLNGLDHLETVAIICETICEKVKRRYQAV
jgi:hypothetical protein